MTERFNKLEELRKAGVPDSEIINALVCIMTDEEFEDHINRACEHIEDMKHLRDTDYFDAF